MFILSLILILSITNCFGQENLNKNDLNVQPIETIDMTKQDQHSLPLLPESIQTMFFNVSDGRTTFTSSMWLTLMFTVLSLVSFISLSLIIKHYKEVKTDKSLHLKHQELRKSHDKVDLELAELKQTYRKLLTQFDEIKERSESEKQDFIQLKKEYQELEQDIQIKQNDYASLQNDFHEKQDLLDKYQLDLQKQMDIVTHLNNEILQCQQDLEKERQNIARLQSNDLSLERFEQLQQIINDLKSENTQLKRDRLAQTEELQQMQQRVNQLDIDNNELTIKLKQLKDLLEQRDQTGIVEMNEEQQRELLSTIDSDVEKANQHMRNLHAEIEEKTRRLKEFDALLNQEKDRCRELETKLKVVLELRERDAHIHIRQLGQTDAELRKARTDTERVRILQQQLELKQKQFEDVQKELTSEQTRFSEECSKLQHETHEKWMEVKRLTRELDGAKKECEGLRRQITKYAQSDRSSQEKTMHKPIAQHLNNTGRLSSEPETNGSSPPTLPYQQGDNFRPIDHERNDSGAASPSEMMRIRPPIFGMPRPPFFPPPFMPPPNPFLMAPRFPMPPGGPHGMISPIPHLMTNGSAGGSDSNSFEMVDSTNITPNSTSYDVQVNGSATSPIPDDEQQATTKVKKPKKSLKKKTKTSATTTVSDTKEDV